MSEFAPRSWQRPVSYIVGESPFSDQSVVFSLTGGTQVGLLSWDGKLVLHLSLS